MVILVIHRLDKPSKLTDCNSEMYLNMPHLRVTWLLYVPHIRVVSPLKLLRGFKADLKVIY
jgi:hypothetical protein